MIAPESILKSFGDIIRVRRKARGLSQETAAGIIGVDYRHYQNVEAGKVNIRIDMLCRLGNFYGITLIINDQSNPGTNDGNKIS